MKKIILCICIAIISLYSFGQDSSRQTTGYKKFEEEYKKYCDSVAKYALMPAVSMLLIKKKELEVNFFNALLTANNYRDGDGKLADLNLRTTYLYNTLQISYGISKKARLNIGFDINAISGRVDNDPNSSFFKIFQPSVEGNSKYAGAIASVAPRLRWRPFKNNYNFTLQSSVSFPTVSSAEKRDVLGQKQVYFMSQFLYNQPLSKKLFLFSQLGIQYGLKNDHAYSILYSPLSLYISYLLLKKTVIFGLLSYTPIFQNVNKWKYEAYALSVGAGIQHNISQQLLINVFYNSTLKGKNYGNYSAYNLGLRLLIK